VIRIAFSYCLVDAETQRRAKTACRYVLQLCHIAAAERCCFCFAQRPFHRKLLAYARQQQRSLLAKLPDPPGLCKPASQTTVCAAADVAALLALLCSAALPIELLALSPSARWLSLLMLVRKHHSVELPADANECSAQRASHSTRSQMAPFRAATARPHSALSAAAAHSQLCLLCLLTLVLTQTRNKKESMKFSATTVCWLLLLLLGAAQGKGASSTNGNAKVYCCRSGTVCTIAATAHTHMRTLPTACSIPLVRDGFRSLSSS
jgi:hypothetical protein